MTPREQAIQEVTEAQARKAAWFAQWPQACTHCEGHGGIGYSYDPSPVGVSLGPGSMYDVDPCEHCVCVGKCPRCAAKFDTEDDKPCPVCGWNWDNGREDSAPSIPEYYEDDFDPHWHDHEITYWTQDGEVVHLTLTATA